MRIAVVGTGAVGGYFGGRLAQAGEDVVFLARGAHLRAIQEQGLQVESVDGDFAIRPAQATDDPAGIGPVDLVLLAVKGWQVPQAIETMRPLVGPETFVVPLLNGVEAPEQLAGSLWSAPRPWGSLWALLAPSSVRATFATCCPGLLLPLVSSITRQAGAASNCGRPLSMLACR